MASIFTLKQEQILNAIQAPLPFAGRPFLVLEKELGIPEQEIIENINTLKQSGVIRNIAGIFNGERLGYKLSLVTFKVPENNIEKAAALINSHPGVSHNYLRDHEYNIWFTIAEENAELLRRSVEVLARKGGASSSLIMENEKLLKIGVNLFIGNSDDSSAKPAVSHLRAAESKKLEVEPLEEHEKVAIRLLQKDMPLVIRPFKELCEESELLEDDFIEIAAGLEEKGIMRRYAAVLRHQKAGYTSNAMTAWKFNTGEYDDKAASVFANESAVTHLYIRTLYPGQWEYPLFAMIHAKSDEELEGLIETLANDSGLSDRLVLRSLKEFKKKRVIYFSSDFEKWEADNYD